MISYLSTAMYDLLPSHNATLWLGVTAVIVWAALRSKDPKRPLPPGPKGLPLLGNLLQLSEDAWLPLTRWAGEYGPVVHIKVLGLNIVVLNTLQAATDLLDRRAAIYSDRPPNIVASKLLTGGMFMPFLKYSQKWRSYRRVSHQCLAKPEVVQFQPYQSAEALYLAETLLKDPNSWYPQLSRSTSSMIMSFLYGLPRIETENDPSIHRINTFTERIVRAALPGAHFVEFFTWMEYLPAWIAPWKRRAQEWFKQDSAMFLGLFLPARKRAAAGTPVPSFSDSIVANHEKFGLRDEEYSWILSTMYAAGAETTSSVLSWFIVAMVLHPHIQEKAQAELDAVVGHDRAPKFSDLQNLPYIQATVKETLRWVPVDPLGLPHASSEDDIYEGYFIPKGTICIANVWAIHRDKDYHGADADSFNPGRYLNPDGSFKSLPNDLHDEGHVTFGFGKRLCHGRHVADNTIFITLATLLWACRIRPGKDANGRDILPDPSSIDIHGLTIHPKPFDVEIKPRFSEVQSVLESLRDIGEY